MRRKRKCEKPRFDAHARGLVEEHNNVIITLHLHYSRDSDCILHLDSQRVMLNKLCATTDVNDEDSIILGMQIVCERCVHCNSFECDYIHAYILYLSWHSV